jgi:regulator of protease activity HflC (stomatin/prohibitin superfamily)
MLVLVGIVVLVVGLVRGVRVVPVGRAGIVERLGSYRRTLPSGLNLIAPFIDRVRLVDLTEHVISFSDVTVKTQDDVAVSVDLFVYAQVVDPKAATYEIGNHQLGIEQLVITMLRNWGGDLKFDEVYSGREKLSGQLRTVLDQAANEWGVRINRMEIERIGTPDGPDTAGLLEMLGKLRAAGVLTNEEFEAKRQQVLSQLSTGTAGPDGV